MATIIVVAYCWECWVNGLFSPRPGILYQVGLTGTSEQVRPTGLPHCEWLDQTVLIRCCYSFLTNQFVCTIVSNFQRFFFQTTGMASWLTEPSWVLDCSVFRLTSSSWFSTMFYTGMFTLRHSGASFLTSGLYVNVLIDWIVNWGAFSSHILILFWRFPFF